MWWMPKVENIAIALIDTNRVFTDMWDQTTILFGDEDDQVKQTTIV